MPHKLTGDLAGHVVGNRENLGEVDRGDKDSVVGADTVWVVSSFASNVLALILVVGISWIGMIALSSFFHRNQNAEPDNLFEEAARRGPMVDDRQPIQRPNDVAPRAAVSVPRNQPCDTCEGVGASTDRGRLHLCPSCEGTGIR